MVLSLIWSSVFQYPICLRLMFCEEVRGELEPVQSLAHLKGLQEKSTTTLCSCPRFVLKPSAYQRAMHALDYIRAMHWTILEIDIAKQWENASSVKNSELCHRVCFVFTNPTRMVPTGHWKRPFHHGEGPNQKEIRGKGTITDAQRTGTARLRQRCRSALLSLLWFFLQAFQESSLL